MSHPFDFTEEEMQERAEHLATMERNFFMRNSGVMGDEALADFLASASIQGTSLEGQFAGFEIVFGFDALGYDFVAVKDLAGKGAHLVFATEE